MPSTHSRLTGMNPNLLPNVSKVQTSTPTNAILYHNILKSHCGQVWYLRMADKTHMPFWFLIFPIFSEYLQQSINGFWISYQGIWEHICIYTHMHMFACIYASFVCAYTYIKTPEVVLSGVNTMCWISPWSQSAHLCSTKLHWFCTSQCVQTSHVLIILRLTEPGYTLWRLFSTEICA